MANYANLEAAIVAAVYENANNEITGAALQSVLLQMVSSMGKSGMLCNGVADSSTTPPVNPDSNIFYIAPTGTYPNFGGLVVADGEWAIFIYNGSWQKQSVPVVTADAVPTTGSTNPVQSGGVADALEQKADIDGYYSTLTAGAAENLVGRGSVLAEYTRRTSGGSADIGSGAATIEKIHGNTIAWNQQINPTWLQVTTTTTGVTITNNGDGSFTLTGTNDGTTMNFVAIITSTKFVVGHKYLLRGMQRQTASAKFKLVDTDNGSATDDGSGVVYTATNGTTFQSAFRLRCDSGASAGTGLRLAPQLIDLTLMFGAGNEPTSVAEFEALFPLNYYAYNTGSLMNLTATGVQTNGFNQWDEEWEIGGIDNSGQPQPSGYQMRSKNYIPVFPSTTYYYECKVSAYANTYIEYYWYDAEKNFILHNALNNHQTSTSPANAYYFKFRTNNAWAGASYTGGICINLSDTARNGEYEAYWSSTLNLPLTSVASGGSAVFADGMKSAGTAYDELTGTKAVKRVEKVDLGTLSWNWASNRFYAQISGCSSRSSGVSNMITAAYPTRNDANSSIGGVQNNGEYCQSQNYVVIYDTNYATTAAFTTAMSGKYLYYELATPVEYTLDSEVNLNYRVDNLGTEAEVPQNTATPTTAPIVYDVRYAMNAVDTLRNLPTNYISKDSLKNLLDAFVSAGVISAYTMTYNAGTEQYTFTITA